MKNEDSIWGKFFFNNYSKRDCLKCNTIFTSAGNHNRICHRCTEKNSDITYTLKERSIYNGNTWIKKINSMD